MFKYILIGGLSLTQCFLMIYLKCYWISATEYDPSSNSNSWFHVAADILNLLILYGCFLFSMYIYFTCYTYTYYTMHTILYYNNSILYYTILYYTILHYKILYYTRLYYVHVYMLRFGTAAYLPFLFKFISSVRLSNK